MNVTCIAASNMINSSHESTSYKIAEIISEILKKKEIDCEILDLRDYDISPCIGCSKCFESKRCCRDKEFNKIYNKAVESDYIFFISAHYAPIPAKLCMLLEKMEEITFLHWWKDNTYKSELYKIPAGIISHGGAPDWALQSYKDMVNDTVANALDTIQFKIVPYNAEWDTGISIPVAKVEEKNSIFPVQEYDWDSIKSKVGEYVELVLKERK